ncbi:type I-E CRISPR-associated protein Cas5/CasD [Fundidesulfovibrio butyratiphilus]
MAAYLLFQLYGPLQSYGGVCPGEIRDSWPHPSKSAVLGLVAGALGITRDDGEALAALDRGYWFAVRQDAPGAPLFDFHTAQTRPGKRGRFASRRQELTKGLKPGESPLTILSTRHYLQDALFTACLRPAGERAPHSLEALAQALRRPVFAPYLGRKSCPPGLPCAPRVVEAEGLAQAFARYAPGRLVRGRLPGGRQTKVRLFWEGPDGPVADHVASRRDALIHRGRWLYRDRDERASAVDPAPWEDS